MDKIIFATVSIKKSIYEIIIGEWDRDGSRGAQHVKTLAKYRSEDMEQIFDHARKYKLKKISLIVPKGKKKNPLTYKDVPHFKE